MEDHNKQHVHGQDDHSTGTWVLITAHAARYFGRIYALNMGELWHLSDLAGSPTEVNVELVVRSNEITLMPTYDFFAPLRPTQVKGEDGQPVMAMARDPLCVGRDFTVKPYPTHIRTNAVSAFDFLSQMHSADQKTYRMFLEQARKANLRASASQAGLELPRG